MADLTDIQAAQSVKIIGANSSGVENNPMTVDANGNAYINLRDSAGLEKGTLTNPIALTPVDGIKTTYSASANAITMAGSPTDMFVITGSATKTIRILKIRFTGSTTANGGVLSDVLLIKRSTDNTGGTSATLTRVPHDSNNAAATAVARSYTANPTTLGTAVGTVRAERFRYTNSGGITQIAEWDFGDRPGQGIVLHGTAQILAVNLNGVSVSNGIASCSFEWTEE